MVNKMKKEPNIPFHKDLLLNDGKTNQGNVFGISIYRSKKIYTVKYIVEEGYITRI